ncbi:hypothetical protein KI811_13995 [Geobacter hydrogenophilus]|uniref:Uncharacterized protein n=1 Tax=Geobacter hydrogenophilus TaxID=40983 RepID=A0A9W6LB30_9BACT|nr:hypothetical protein [Geobacter hydrogenophilus]MBT0894921.1 hypothetical protein [Geobacter hydrogenophilus]GLI36674.1 hypothetical protein GHYDROH2_01750 [Geobacter hydrogenophilus]
MNVIITGLPFFANKIANGLSKFNHQDHYKFVNIDGSLVDKFNYIANLVKADLLYIIGGDNKFGFTLFFAFLLRKRIVMHWVGTDVLVARENFQAGKSSQFLVKYSRHLCEAGWIQQELREIGIDAKVAQIACIELAPESELSFPNEFSILTYIGRGREDFYGMKKIIEIARTFPDIAIRVIGIDSYWSEEELPANIQLVGWVDDTREEFLRCVVYLRLTEHDGLSFSVLEALSFGRYVGYSYEVEGVRQVTDHASLVNFIKEHLNNFRRGALAINELGRNAIQQYHGEYKVYSGLISEFRF